MFLRISFCALLLASGDCVLADPVLAPRIDWSGDIRYRLAKGHEDIDENRSYQQLRVRLGLRAEVNDDVHAVIRLATANAQSSAINSNQTLGESTDPGMPRRGFGIDL